MAAIFIVWKVTIMEKKKSHVDFKIYVYHMAIFQADPIFGIYKNL